MISARHWKERRVFWRAFVFWAWLASFVFGFAASDLFHAPNCPEQLALRAAHNSGATRAVASSSAAHALPTDADCPTCLLQLVALGIAAVAAMLAAPFFGAPFFARSQRSHAVAVALICSARGPPVSFI